MTNETRAFWSNWTATMWSNSIVQFIFVMILVATYIRLGSFAMWIVLLTAAAGAITLNHFLQTNEE